MDQRSQIQNKKIAYLRLMKKIDEKNSSINKVIQYENWNKHNQLTRGNPVRVYKGMNFKKDKNNFRVEFSSLLLIVIKK